MHEINPVLAGTFDAPNYAPANNFASATNASPDATSGVDDVSGPDPRRYTKFDHSDTEAGTATNFTFSDLLDMLNPLEHIPVVSSVYRAIVGEDINPVSRVAGDILYGGVLGAGSAVFSGVSAVADAGLEETAGKDSGGLMMAALFGTGDKNDNVQLADAVNTNAATGAAASVTASTPTTKNIELAAATPTPLLAALALPGVNSSPAPTPANDTMPALTPAPAADSANVTPVRETPGATPAALDNASAQVSAPAPVPVPSSAPAVSQNTVTNATLASGSSTAAAAAPLGGIPLAQGKAPNSKQPFGGVMSNGNLQAQDMAMALAQGSSPSMRMGHMIYTNNLVNGQHSLPPQLSAGMARAGPPVAVIMPRPSVPPPFTPVSATSPAASSNAGSNGGTAGALSSPASQSSAASESLMQDMMLKALGQYGKVATGPASSPGASINVTN